MKNRKLMPYLICALIVFANGCGQPAVPEAIDSEREAALSSEVSVVSAAASEEAEEEAIVESESTLSSASEEQESPDQVFPPEVAADYQITRNVYGIVSDAVFDWEVEYTDIEIDPRGNIISENVEGSNRHTMRYEYDSHNRMIRALQETKLYGTEEFVCTYDENGLMTEARNTKTDKSGNVIENTYAYTYDEQGYYVSCRHVGGSGNVYDLSFENDDQGRIVKITETEDGAAYGTMTFTYDEGVYNPAHISVTRNNGRGYEEDLAYDDRGRVVNDDIVYKKDGKKTAFEFTYDVVGEITESPETNPDLIPGDKWEFFDECPLLPIPSSCVGTICDSADGSAYELPTFRGCFLFSMGYPSFTQHILESSYAMTALDQYTAILEETLGYDVKRMGNIIKVSHESTEVAVLNIAIEKGKYILTVIPA